MKWLTRSQNISKVQKMSRLLHFLDRQTRRAVTLKMLEQGFGQPHVVAKACVDALVEEKNISSSDKQGLREIADISRTFHETLQSMNVLSEMNITNSAKNVGKVTSCASS